MDAVDSKEPLIQLDYNTINTNNTHKYGMVWYGMVWHGMVWYMV